MDYNKNYYNILGVDKNASETDIKQAFKKLAIKHHPDKGGNENAFKTINEAYSILTDNTQKGQYDKSSPHGKIYSPNFAGFGNFGSNLDEVFNTFGFAFGKRTQYREYHENLDINVNLIITTRDVYKANPIEIKYKRYVHCEVCDGTGFDRNGNSDICEMCYGVGRDILGQNCQYCQGKGKVYSGQCPTCKGEKIVIKDISFNLNNVQSIRKSGKEILRGYGHQSKYFREKKGILNLNIIYEHLPQYEVDGDKIISFMDLHYEDAIKGCDFEYIHLDNSKMIIKIPPKTKDKDIIIIKEKGLVISLNNRGDLLFKINIIIDYNRIK